MSHLHQCDGWVPSHYSCLLCHSCHTCTTVMGEYLVITSASCATHVTPAPLSWVSTSSLQLPPVPLMSHLHHCHGWVPSHYSWLLCHSCHTWTTVMGEYLVNTAASCATHVTCTPLSWLSTRVSGFEPFYLSWDSGTKLSLILGFPRILHFLMKLTKNI